MGLEDDIRREVEGKKYEFDVEVDWYTPSGNRRTAPMFIAKVNNAYLGKTRVIKTTNNSELELKIRECVMKWGEQEIKKKITQAKKDNKEKGKAEAERLDSEAKAYLLEIENILNYTLDIDDTLDWAEERDTRIFPEFSFKEPPVLSVPAPPIKGLRPSWGWLFRKRVREWEDAFQCRMQRHEEECANKKSTWKNASAEHKRLRDEEQSKHEKRQAEFLNQQEDFNEALKSFRKRFENGELEAIKEYCSRVLEKSVYPENIELSNTVDFDEETGFVVVNLDLPQKILIPEVTGYKYVAKTNTSSRVKMPKKKADALYEETNAKIALRTIHEILESCYIGKVQGVLFNGFAVNLNKATGKDERKQLICVAAERKTFEDFDLRRIDPQACIEMLSEKNGTMKGVG